MKYVLGIDSGGTKYLIRASDLSGKTLGEYKGPCCSHYVGGPELARKRIGECVSACLATFGGKPEDCAALVCGTTGWDSEEDGVLINGFYHDLPGFDCPMLCMNDVGLAFHATLGDTGVLALAGTGSIFYGRTADGREARVGGWPKGVMGEEGSGRYIDALALRHYSRWLDGCREDSELLREIEKTIGEPGRKALMTYAETVSRPDFSSSNLTPAVNRAAEAGDPWAAGILKQAAAALMEPLAETIALLKLDREPSFRVGVWGGVILNCRIYQEEFSRLLKQAYPGAQLVLPQRDAADGAVDLALNLVRDR